MRDIPLFTTQNGVASLLFKKIPFTGEAFVHIRDTADCNALVRECVDVCRMAGGETVYATGHGKLTAYPLACAVLRYRVHKDLLAMTEAVAIPITMEQKAWWRDVYNRKMASVMGASPLSESETDRLISEEKAFLIYLACSAIGIGVAYDGEIQAVAALVPGGGQDSVLALANLLDSDTVALCVASNNEKAIALYSALGFCQTGVEANWYKIF